MRYKDLYAEIGKLLYAVAVADGAVREEEMSRVKKEVKNSWLNWEDSKDEFGTDAANYILLAFESAQDIEASSEEAWESFQVFYKLYQNAFHNDLKNQIERSATAVAASFSSFNKSELGILSRLHLLFQEPDALH